MEKYVSKESEEQRAIEKRKRMHVLQENTVGPTNALGKKPKNLEALLERAG